jgi:hypothetical protein
VPIWKVYSNFLKFKGENEEEEGEYDEEELMKYQL